MKSISRKVIGAWSQFLHTLGNTSFPLSAKQRRRGWQRMRWLDNITDSNGHEFEQTPGDSEGQGSLVCYSPWGRKESDIT